MRVYENTVFFTPRAGRPQVNSDVLVGWVICMRHKSSASVAMGYDEEFSPSY